LKPADLTYPAVSTSPQHNMTTAPSDLLKEIDRCNRSIKAYQLIIDECKAGLQAHRELGTIGDTFVEGNIQASWQERKTWTYSPAVKNLQQQEQLEGIATQKTSASWTIRELKNASTDSPD
jgi:hypothetical protein